MRVLKETRELVSSLLDHYNREKINADTPLSFCLNSWKTVFLFPCQKMCLTHCKTETVKQHVLNVISNSSREWFRAVISRRRGPRVLMIKSIFTPLFNAEKFIWISVCSYSKSFSCSYSCTKFKLRQKTKMTSSIVELIQMLQYIGNV